MVVQRPWPSFSDPGSEPVTDEDSVLFSEILYCVIFSQNDNADRSMVLQWTNAQFEQMNERLFFLQILGFSFVRHTKDTRKNDWILCKRDALALRYFSLLVTWFWQMFSAVFSTTTYVVPVVQNSNTGNKKMLSGTWSRKEPKNTPRIQIFSGSLPIWQHSQLEL